MKTKFNILILLLITASTINAQEFSWQIDGVMPHPVAGGSALVIDEYIYIIGGYSKEMQEPVNWIQRFNPNTNEWLIVDSISSPRYGLLADVYNNSIYYTGGRAAANSLNENLFNLEIWSMVDDSFSNFVARHNSFNRSFATGGIVGNKFYLFGGSSFVLSDSIELPYLTVVNLDTKEVQIELDTLYNSSYLPEQQMSISRGEKIYIFGGVTNGVQDKILIFNTTTNTFTEPQTTMPVPVAGGSIVYRETQDAALIIGGFHENLPAISQTNYFILQDTSVISFPGPNLSYPRRNAMAVNYYGQVYVFGGYDLSGEVLSTFEKLSDEATTAATVEDKHLVEKYSLSQNYPNPFNPSTNISYHVKSHTNVRIDIFNLLGENVKTLVDNYTKPGKYTITWDGTNQGGENVSAGTYFYVMSLPDQKISKKMLLLK